MGGGTNSSVGVDVPGTCSKDGGTCGGASGVPERQLLQVLPKSSLIQKSEISGVSETSEDTSTWTNLHILAHVRNSGYPYYLQ